MSVESLALGVSARPAIFSLSPETTVAIHLAQWALRWKVMKDLARSAARRIEKLLWATQDPVLQGKLYLVLWALRKLPYSRTSLIARALRELEAVSEYLGELEQCDE